MEHPRLGPERQAWFDRAVSLIDEKRIHRLAFELTGIHSPTGRERAASEFMVARLAEAGLDARYQPMGEASGNAAARLRGSGGGPSLLLYAPIDTHLEADPATDIPWVGPGLRRDMIPEPVVRDGLIVGLGAANPKAMVVAQAEAARVVAEAGIPLTGDLLVGFAGGGMPVDLAAPGNRGLSDGVFHLLTRGFCADFALVMKPGNAVYHEEPGLCWFKVSVRGTMGYAGIARGVPGFRSSIVPAASVIAAQLGAAIAEIRANHPDIDLDWEMTASIPGASTDPESWIVRSAIAGWEAVEGRTHEPPRRTSGQTDISTIRNLGIPTARTGWVSTPDATPDEFRQGLGGMGVTCAPDLAHTCRKLVYTIVDTCTRTREEVGCVHRA